MRTRVLLLVTCVLSAVGLVVSGSDIYALKQNADRGEPIPQPDHWVAFEATIKRVAIDGRVIPGRFYRGSDGSELTIESDVKPSEIVTIRHIANYTDGRYYHSTKPGEWISGPLVVPGPRRQIRFFTKSPGLRQYRGRLALLARQDGSLQAMDGVDAWVTTTEEGSVHVLAPALNFVPVISTSLNGHRRILSDIRVGPVQATLFQPPAGDNVTVVEETFPPHAEAKR